jgi:cytochrome P450
MTATEVNAQVMTILLAGEVSVRTTLLILDLTYICSLFIETADTIGWALYELAKNQAYQDRMRSEIFEFYTEKNELDIASLDKMPITAALIKASLVFPLF